MKLYKTIDIVKLFEGVLLLTSSQASARTLQVKEIETDENGDGLFEIIKGPVTFKVGEVFGFSQDIPKSIAKSVVIVARVQNADTGEVTFEVEPEIQPIPVAESEPSVPVDPIDPKNDGLEGDDDQPPPVDPVVPPPGEPETPPPPPASPVAVDIKAESFKVFDAMNDAGLLDPDTEANKEYLTGEGMPEVKYVNSKLPEGVTITAKQRNAFFEEWENIE